MHITIRGKRIKITFNRLYVLTSVGLIVAGIPVLATGDKHGWILIGVGVVCLLLVAGDLKSDRRHQQFRLAHGLDQASVDQHLHLRFRRVLLTEMLGPVDRRQLVVWHTVLHKREAVEQVLDDLLSEGLIKRVSQNPADTGYDKLVTAEAGRAELGRLGTIQAL